MVPHRANHQLRRVGRVLRSRAAAARAASRRRPRRGIRRAPRIPHAHPPDLAVRAPGAYVSRGLRSYVDTAADRMALESRAVDGARRHRQQSGRRVGLQEPAIARAGLRRPARRWAAVSGQPRAGLVAALTLGRAAPRVAGTGLACMSHEAAPVAPAMAVPMTRTLTCL